MIPDSNIKILALAIDAVKARNGAVNLSAAAYRQEIKKAYKLFESLLSGGLLDDSKVG
jgi:hypothetical protein